MYTKVSFKYNGENIYNLFVAVHSTVFSSPYYVIMGISHEDPFPTAIGQAGIFKDVFLALERLNLIAEKYPYIDDEDYEIPEFFGI